MDVTVHELRNDTARVIAAIEAGTPVVLTDHGRPVADIVPRRVRAEGRSTEDFLADLDDLRRAARQLGMTPRPDDYDVGLTTDDAFRA